MADGVTVEGVDKLNAKLVSLAKGVFANMQTAVKAGLLPIQTGAKDNLGDTGTHPQVTGTLARSINIQVVQEGVTAIGRVGSNLDYAEEEELSEGHSYLVKSLEEHRDEAVEDVAFALRAIIKASL